MRRARARSKEFCQQGLSNRYYTNPVDHASDLRKSRVHDFQRVPGMPGRWGRSTGLTGPFKQDRLHTVQYDLEISLSVIEIVT
jgi:hypothetical protein